MWCSAYEEIGQLGNSKIGLGLADLTSYPTIVAWLGAMDDMPGHAAAHGSFATKMGGAVKKLFQKQGHTMAKL